MDRIVKSARDTENKKSTNGFSGFNSVVLLTALMSVLGMGVISQAYQPPYVSDFSDMSHYSGSRVILEGTVLSLDEVGGGASIRLLGKDASSLLVTVDDWHRDDINISDIIEAEASVTADGRWAEGHIHSSDDVTLIKRNTSRRVQLSRFNGSSGELVTVRGLVHSLAYGYFGKLRGFNLEEGKRVIMVNCMGFETTARPGQIVDVMGVFDNDSSSMDTFSPECVVIINSTYMAPVNIDNLLSDPQKWVGRDVTLTGYTTSGYGSYNYICRLPTLSGPTIKVKFFGDMDLNRGDTIRLAYFRMSYNVERGYYYLAQGAASEVSIIKPHGVWNLTLEELMADVISFKGSTVNVTGNYWGSGGGAVLYHSDVSIRLFCTSVEEVDNKDMVAVYGTVFFDSKNGSYALKGESVWKLL